MDADVVVEIARASGTPPWMISVAIGYKVKQLRALAGEAQTLATTVRTLSAKIITILDKIINDNTTDTCTLLQLLDPLVTQYNTYRDRLNEIRTQIDQMLQDPEIQKIVSPMDIQTYYKAKNDSTRAYLVQFANLPPDTPTIRTKFIEKIQQLRTTIEQAQAIIEENEPLVVNDFRQSQEYAEIQALIAKLVEEILPDIKELKAGRITETEFWAKVNAQIQQLVATIKEKINTWLNRNRQALARIQSAKKDLQDAQTALNAMLQDCPDLKRKYNIIDRPEEVKP
ncbi:MAG: hypothetical protein JHC26_10665 [Thermofilum sp.]|jgi:chromosome segregation ATPase|uniref:hypothetical protein n=1 Tax=Thermofilum sp. TaxID=1961369 RepID=UPI00258A20A2|nr:hypothetical protein [Thermofilum sp.]MCI4409543.1 hypothetical protein [Thermofilum sp.]